MGNEGDIFKPTTDDSNYDVNKDAEHVVGPVNAAEAPSDGSNGQQASPQQSFTQSIGERASTPNYDEGIREGIVVSDQVHRGQQRANWITKELNTNKEHWADWHPKYKLPHSKCNEFVYEAHFSGDPQGSAFPTVLRDNPSYYKPTVDNLADPNFAPNDLEYHTDINSARPGDIIVWYGNGHHHSAIATGNGNVIYASTDGAKTNSIAEASRSFPGATPIIRRYK